MGAIGRNLERDWCPLHATNLPAFGKHRAPLGGESSDAASDDKGERLGLALVGALIDEEAGRTLGLPRPKITLPSTDPDEVQTVEIDIAVPATLDVPEEDRLTEAVVWRLSECAGARDSAAAVVEPLAGELPAGTVGHENLPGHEQQKRTPSRRPQRNPGAIRQRR
jgi:hypothetical protein